MGSLNKVMLIGRLGKDPEIRYTQSGSAVANFSIATSDVWKDKQGQRQEKTEWHNVIAWDRLADLAQNYLKKGSQVYIEGRLQTSSWDDQQGQKRYKTEVVAVTIQFLESRASGDSSSAGYGASTYSAPTTNPINTHPSSGSSSPMDAQSDPAEMYIKDDMPF